jgi:hypothetical protein
MDFISNTKTSCYSMWSSVWVTMTRLTSHLVQAQVSPELPSNMQRSQLIKMEIAWELPLVLLLEAVV